MIPLVIRRGEGFACHRAEIYRRARRICTAAPGHWYNTVQRYERRRRRFFAEPPLSLDNPPAGAGESQVCDLNAPTDLSGITAAVIEKLYDRVAVATYYTGDCRSMTAAQYNCSMSASVMALMQSLQARLTAVEADNTAVRTEKAALRDELAKKGDRP